MKGPCLARVIFEAVRLQEGICVASQGMALGMAHSQIFLDAIVFYDKKSDEQHGSLRPQSTQIPNQSRSGPP